MPDTDIGKATTSDLSNSIEETTIDSASTDGASGDEETKLHNADWKKQYGIYKTIPEVKSAFDALTDWTVGKGYIADETTTLILDEVRGRGKESFNEILKNGTTVRKTGGDSYSEIITDNDGVLINLKPIDPETMTVILNSKGLIIRYEQISKVKGKKPKKYKPEQIFHLSNNRIADNGLGESAIDALEWIIIAKKEAMEIQKTVTSRYARPVIIWHLDTDDETKIANFKETTNNMSKDGENVFIPKGAVVPEVLAVAPNQTLNIISWLDYLDARFTQVSGVPDVILGNSKNLTEASSKIAYLAFEQTVKAEQLYIEEQVLAQLNLVINLEFPASLENELLSDSNKDITNGAAQPNETTAGSGQ